MEEMTRREELTKAKKAGRRRTAGRWKLEDAKARFSEVVRHAREEGPQRVSVRGHDAVVVMSVEDFERLAPKRPRAPFVEFMESRKAFILKDSICVVRRIAAGTSSFEGLAARHQCRRCPDRPTGARPQ